MSARRDPAYNPSVDYRFKYRRGKLPPQEQAEEERVERDTVSRMRGVAFGLSIPIVLASGPIAGWLVGAWLDHLLGTAFWELTLIILGAVAGLKMTVDMLVRLGRTQ